MARTIRTIFNLPVEFYQQLRFYAKRKNVKLGTAIVRLIALGLFLDAEELRGAKILLEDRKGKFHRVIQKSR